MVDQEVDKVKKLKIKEMMLQRASQVSLIGYLVFEFDPVNYRKEITNLNSLEEDPFTLVR